MVSMASVIVRRLGIEVESNGSARSKGVGLIENLIVPWPQHSKRDLGLLPISEQENFESPWIKEAHRKLLQPIVMLNRKLVVHHCKFARSSRVLRWMLVHYLIACSRLCSCLLVNHEFWHVRGNLIKVSAMKRVNGQVRWWSLIWGRMFRSGGEEKQSAWSLRLNSFRSAFWPLWWMFPWWRWGWWSAVNQSRRCRHPILYHNKFTVFINFLKK